MPTLEMESLPYRRDSAPWMQALATLHGAAFLDSGPSRQPHARFDILSALPDAVLSVPLHGAEEAEDAFARTQRWLESHAPSSEVLRDPRFGDLPFRGGAIGYFGYETRRDLTTFRARGDSADHPQPRLPRFHLGLYRWALTIDHERRHCALFFLPECPRETREQVREALQAAHATTTRPDAPVPPFRLLTPFRADMQRHQYRLAFDRLMRWIRDGDCYQANLAQRFHARYEGNPLTAYLRLRQRSHSPFSAYLCPEPGQSILSLSPERFLRVRGRQVLTQPIKGTRRRGNTPEEDRELADSLRCSAKDRAENLMIVDLLRNDLGSRCETGSVKVTALFELQSYSAVHHLVSSVTARLRPEDHALALLGSCFPGGSITGAPKIRAMQIIDALEPDHRSVYCGSVVWAGFDGNLDSSIAIRTLACDSRHVYCWGGGGIVSDSDGEQEHQESIDKISMLISTLKEFYTN